MSNTEVWQDPVPSWVDNEIVSSNHSNVLTRGKRHSFIFLLFIFSAKLPGEKELWMKGLSYLALEAQREPLPVKLQK